MRAVGASPIQFLIKFNTFLTCPFNLLHVCVCRLELLLQRANKIQNMALDCEEKLTLAKNTLQAVSADPLIFYLAFISSEAPTQGLG